MKLVDLEGFKFDLSGLAYILPTDWQRIGEYFMRQLKERPVVELKPRWILCSERLPEESGWYLVSVRTGNVAKAFYRVAPIKQGGSYWRGSIKKPIAWMPLPEAFKEDTNGTDI